MGKVISYKEIEAAVSSDWQPFDYKVTQWHATEKDKDSYSLEEVIEGVNNGAIPFAFLCYIKSYVDGLSEEEESLIKKTLKIDDSSEEVRLSYNVKNSARITDSKNVENSEAVDGSLYVYDSKNIFNSEYVQLSENVSLSNGIYKGRHIHQSESVDLALYIEGSSFINGSSHIAFSSNVSNSLFCFSCREIENSLFCAFLKSPDSKYNVFNNAISEEKFKRILGDIQRMFGDIIQAPSKLTDAMVEDFKNYCALIPGYDETLFNFIMSKTLVPARDGKI